MAVSIASGAMQRTPTILPVGFSPEDGPNPVFNVVIAYDDFETGKNAKRVYDVLAEHLGKECELSSQMWKFDVLNIPKLLEMAGRDAEVADIIVVSCHEEQELPASVKRWLEIGLSGTPIALVGLFEASKGNPAAAREYLAGAAKRANVEFFASPGSSSCELPPGEAASSPEVPKLDAKTLSMLSGMVRQEPTSGWESDFPP